VARKWTKRNLGGEKLQSKKKVGSLQTRFDHDVKAGTRKEVKS